MSYGRRRIALIAAALLVAVAASARAAPRKLPLPGDAPIPKKLVAPKTPNDIRDAHVRVIINRGLTYLKSLEKRNGLIGTERKVFNGRYPVGQTALAMLAMLEAGVPWNDPHIRAAMTYTFETPTDRTYDIALQAMVLSRLPRDKLGRTQRRAMASLMQRFVDAQAADGMWTYWLLDPRRVPNGERHSWGKVVGVNWRKEFLSGDRSNTQFAILSLWEMSKRGVEIPARTLRLAADQFRETQTSGSGWSYINNPKKYGHPDQTPTMNATGLASLYILRDLLGEVGEGVFTGSRSLGCGKPGRLDEAIERAHSRVVRDLGTTGGLLHLYGGDPFPRSGYYHYSIERVGVACGLKQLGDHDWYREGAWYFLNNQQKNGSWTVGYTPGIETSFALLFLAKGRAPFLANKLRWRGDWNAHTRDLSNLVRYAENTFEQRFRWQIVDVRGKVDEWLDAPVLYVTGHKSPTVFTDDEKKKLRAFALRGGIILGEACCGAKAFDTGFRALVAEVFPEAKLEELTKEHPVWTSHYKLKPERRKPLWGLTLPRKVLEPQGQAAAGKNATRTVVIYAPWAVGCAWNQNQTTRYERLFQLGINVFRYATGNRPLRRPLDGFSKPVPANLTPKKEAPRPKTDDEPLK